MTAQRWLHGVRAGVTTSALIAMAAPLMAQPAEELAGGTLVCLFSTECYEEEACTFTRYSLDVSIPEALPGEAALLLDAGPAKGGATANGGMLFVAAEDETAVYLMTRAPNTDTRLSVHLTDPLQVITYHGRCEVAE